MRAALALGLFAAVSCSKEQPASAAVAVKSAPYQVGLSAKGAYVAGEPASAVVSIVARDGFHVNPDYPVKFTASNEATVRFATPSVSLLDSLERVPCEGHADETCCARAPISFSVGEAGAASVAGTLAFSVCNADQCLIEKVPLSLQLTAAAK